MRLFVYLLLIFFSCSVSAMTPSDQANVVIAQAQAITAAADELAQKFTSYSKAHVSNSNLLPLLQKIPLLQKMGNDPFQTPWGTEITISNVTDNSYKVTIPNIPVDVCKIVSIRLLTNNHYSKMSPCNSSGDTDLSYIYLANPPQTMMPLNQPEPIPLLNIWLTDVIVNAFSLDYLNYNGKIKMFKGEFSDIAWNLYMKGLGGQTIELVRTKKLKTSVMLTSPPQILVQGLLNNVYTYKLKIPLTIFYFNENNDYLYNYDYVVTVIVIPTVQGAMQIIYFDSSQLASAQNTQALPKNSIEVISGSYGINCGATPGNNTSMLANACNGTYVCSYLVDYMQIGDPAPNCAKDYRAEWKCGGGILNTATIPAEAGYKKTIKLACPAS